MAKKARVGHETLILDVTGGGKQILDIPARNEAIDLWNLQACLAQGPGRATWRYFVDFILTNFLENSYLNIRPRQITALPARYKYSNFLKHYATRGRKSNGTCRTEVHPEIYRSVDQH
jgi:hypothetical protein